MKHALHQVWSGILQPSWKLTCIGVELKEWQQTRTGPVKAPLCQHETKKKAGYVHYVAKTHLHSLGLNLLGGVRLHHVQSLGEAAGQGTDVVPDPV